MLCVGLIRDLVRGLFPLVFIPDFCRQLTIIDFHLPLELIRNIEILDGSIQTFLLALRSTGLHEVIPLRLNIFDTPGLVEQGSTTEDLAHTNGFLVLHNVYMSGQFSIAFHLHEFGSVLCEI